MDIDDGDGGHESPLDPPDVPPLVVKRSTLIAQQTYWDSPEAYALFLPVPEFDKSSRHTLERRIRLLDAVQNKEVAWTTIVQGAAQYSCSNLEIFETRHRCLFLRSAYRVALAKLGWNGAKGCLTWMQCCEKACQDLNNFGIKLATNAETLQKYIAAFRSNEMFPNPKRHAALGDKPEPPLLHTYPKLKRKINS